MNLKPILVLVPLTGVLLLVASLFKDVRTISNCQSNLKQIGLGFKQYERDWDEKTVPARNWKEASFPYLKSLQVYDCPAEAFGYAFNRYLSNISCARVDNATKTPTLFDSTSTWEGANDFGKSWPEKGAHRKGKRESRGNNVLYYDGHVKWEQRKPKFKAIKAAFVAPTHKSPSRLVKPSPRTTSVKAVPSPKRRTF